MSEKNDRNDRFIGEADSVEVVGYMGKDGKIHKDLPPEDRMDVSKFYDKDEQADDKQQ